MASTCGGSVCVSASLTTTAGNTGATGSARPGEPLTTLLTRKTAVGLFIIPVCYVFVQGLVERRKKPKPINPPATPHEGGHG